MLVQSHRGLFQAPRRDIVLGNSRTGCHTYAVNLWRVRLCLTSNSWYEDLEELKPADRQWAGSEHHGPHDHQPDVDRRGLWRRLPRAEGPGRPFHCIGRGAPGSTIEQRCCRRGLSNITP